MSAILIIDGDSITGVFAEKLLSLLTTSNHDIAKAYIASKDSSVRVKYRNRLIAINPDVELVEKEASSQPNDADIICAVWAGMIITELEYRRSEIDETVVFVMSHDKLVISIARFFIEAGISVCLPNTPIASVVDYSNNLVTIIDIEAKAIPKPTPIYDLPDWYNTNDQIKMSIGLRCIKVPNESIAPAPVCIPFLESQQKITIGKQGTISLAPWDEPEGLYSPHVEIEYHPSPLSEWTIRAFKGMRRGRKATLVNDKHISATSGSVAIHCGDTIALGGFLFVFETNRIEEYVRYEDPAEMIIDIEKHYKELVSSIPQNCLPRYLIDDLTVDGVFSWEHAYFKDYRRAIISNWNSSAIDTIRNYFSDKQEFKELSVDINRIRNLIMHPSKGALSEEDRRLLASYYVSILKH